MVSLETSQIKRISDRLFFQSGVLKNYHDTRFCMDRFFSSKFEIQIYGHKQSQKNQNLIQAYWRLSWMKNRFFLTKKLSGPILMLCGLLFKNMGRDLRDQSG